MFAVIQIRNFCLQAILRSEQGLSDKPCLLMTSEDKAMVVEMTPMAERSGVKIRMTASQAMARCDQVVLRSKNLSAEEESRSAVLAIAFTLSPRVEHTGEGIWTIDLSGRAFALGNGEFKNVVTRLANLGFTATLGVASTPLLATYAARIAEPVFEVTDAKGFLARLPLSMAAPSDELEQILRTWGLSTLGDLTDLSKHEVGRRLGQEGVDLWERAAGKTTRLILPVKPPVTFEASMEFEQEIETLEPLLFILRRFVERLSVELMTVGSVADELHLCLSLDAEATYDRDFRLPDPTADADILFRALHAHLETLQTASTIRGARLRIIPTRPLVKQQGLFETGLRDPHGFTETLARLSAVMGADRIGTPRMGATHRSDAFALEKPVEVLGPVWKKQLPPLGLPLRRYRPPISALVELAAELPNFVHSEVATGGIIARRGPWRKSGEWWGTENWSVEEWDVELKGGGLYRLRRSKEGWVVEGMYD